MGTGTEHRIAVDSGEILARQNPGVVTTSTARPSSSMNDDGEYDEYLKLAEVPALQPDRLHNHRPIVHKGDALKPATCWPMALLRRGELALGQNLMVAYMPWEGYNYEDAIIVSERVVAEDLLTSIHISEYEIDARDTKLGPEEITREIPNISDDMISDLDADGIIRIGAEVFPATCWSARSPRRARPSSPPKSACCAPSSVRRPRGARHLAQGAPRRRRPRHRHGRFSRTTATNWHPA